MIHANVNACEEHHWNCSICFTAVSNTMYIVTHVWFFNNKKGMKPTTKYLKRSPTNTQEGKYRSRENDYRIEETRKQLERFLK